MDLNPCIPSCWSFDGEKSSKQHEKGLDLYQSFRNYYAAWPLQRAAVCIVTNHRLQPLQGKCRKSTQVCAITALVREIQSPAAVPLDTNPQTPAGTSSSGVKRGTCKWCRGQKKRTLSSCICCGGHTCKEHQVICCKSCWKDWTHTHTHTHTHTQFSH